MPGVERVSNSTLGRRGKCEQREMAMRQPVLLDGLDYNSHYLLANCPGGSPSSGVAVLQLYDSSDRVSPFNLWVCLVEVPDMRAHKGTKPRPMVPMAKIQLFQRPAAALDVHVSAGGKVVVAHSHAGSDHDVVVVHTFASLADFPDSTVPTRTETKVTDRRVVGLQVLPTEVLAVATDRGFQPETELWPVKIELAHPDRARIGDIRPTDGQPCRVLRSSVRVHPARMPDCLVLTVQAGGRHRLRCLRWDGALVEAVDKFDSEAPFLAAFDQLGAGCLLHSGAPGAPAILRFFSLYPTRDTLLWHVTRVEVALPRDGCHGMNLSLSGGCAVVGCGAATDASSPLYVVVDRAARGARRVRTLRSRHLGACRLVGPAVGMQSPGGAVWRVSVGRVDEQLNVMVEYLTDIRPPVDEPGMAKRLCLR
jgi:hypothetical protein